MSCERFDRWLDEGRPEPSALFASHAATCARCAAAWRAAEALERALEAAPTAAPSGFAARVMARVHDTPRAVVVSAPLPPALPWWVRAAAEPAAAGAFAIAALIAWQPGALTAAALAVAARAAQWNLVAPHVLERLRFGNAFTLADASPMAAWAAALSLGALAAWGAWEWVAWSQSPGRIVPRLRRG